MADTNTVVGESILIKGNLEGDEDLTVQGRIEGAIHLTKTLIVEPTGVVKADVSVANAIISGIMVGNLTATDSVELAESGRMVGDIQSPRVIITEGALFKGRVDMGDLQLPRSATASSGERPKPAYKPAPLPRPTPKAEPAKAAPRVEPPRAAARPEPAKAAPRAEPPKVAMAEALAGASKKKVVIKKKH